MDVLYASNNLTELYVNKRSMDTQIGALNVARSRSSKSSLSSTPGGLRHRDPETDYKVRRVTHQVNEAINLAANEPSLGYYRIQEHVHRTLPQLVQRKKELKENSLKIEGISYDLGLSINVIESVSTISTFTRIQEALKTAIQLKKKLNLTEEQERARADEDAKKAKEANKSLSLNERAEGYICPVCYFALTSQDELIVHWQGEHSLQNYDNDVFQEIEAPAVEEQQVFVVNQMHDLTVIDVVPPRISECEDVVESFKEHSNRISETRESSASDASESDLSTSNVACETNSDISTSNVACETNSDVSTSNIACETNSDVSTSNVACETNSKYETDSLEGTEFPLGNKVTVVNSENPADVINVMENNQT